MPPRPQTGASSKARRTLPAKASLLTDKQTVRIEGLLDAEEHVEVESIGAFYQHLVAACRHPDRAGGREMGTMSSPSRVPQQLAELAAWDGR